MPNIKTVKKIKYLNEYTKVCPECSSKIQGSKGYHKLPPHYWGDYGLGWLCNYCNNILIDGNIHHVTVGENCKMEEIEDDDGNVARFPTFRVEDEKRMSQNTLDGHKYKVLKGD